MAAISAHNLARQISQQGYSETLLEKPMGFEEALEGKLHEEQAELNDKIAEAGGFLKNKIPWRDIEYLPVTCLHIFAAVNIIEGGAWIARRIVQ